MPIPELPKVQPVIPSGYLFVAIRRKDPTLPVVIMGWPTERHDAPGGEKYIYPLTQENLERRCAEERIDMDSWQIVRYSDIPDDRLYRDALELTNGVLAHNVAKARDAHRQHIRDHRHAKFAALDLEYQRADEEKDLLKKDAVTAKKQRLRDLPAAPEIDAAQTITQLKAFWPDELS